MNAMVFCNTCDQALCNECRRLIHSAKMFSKHEVVPVEKRAQKQKKICGKLNFLYNKNVYLLTICVSLLEIHGEEYIMYSPSEKMMLCINCFRDIDK